MVLSHGPWIMKIVNPEGYAKVNRTDRINGKRQLKTMHLLLIGLLGLQLAACAGVPEPAKRKSDAVSAAPAGFHADYLETHEFKLFALLPENMRVSEDGILTVLIEGDGFAYLRRDRASDDPTPLSQTVIELLPRDGRSNVVYLARPCQFTGHTDAACDVSVWTLARYSERVIDTMDEAVTLLKTSAHATKLRLIGYSGGGVVAALLSARRADVVSLVTIAAPLDTDAFVAVHSVSPLDGSLNPRDFAQELSTMPQVHFVGEQDKIVPRQILESYLAALPNKACAEIVTVSGASHGSGWSMISPMPVDQQPACHLVHAKQGFVP